MTRPAGAAARLVRALLWTTALAGPGLALSPGGAPAALRAGGAACGLGAAAALLRPALRRQAGPRRLALVARQALSREAGVALLEVDGRPVLVGFGGCVRLLEPGPRGAGTGAAAPPEGA